MAGRYSPGCCCCCSEHNLAAEECRPFHSSSEVASTANVRASLADRLDARRSLCPSVCVAAAGRSAALFRCDSGNVGKL